jgi:hypothetical protein
MHVSRSISLQTRCFLPRNQRIGCRLTRNETRPTGGIDAIKTVAIEYAIVYRAIMAEQVSDFKRGENKARAITVGVLSSTFLIAAMAPQNTRAVFITDGGLPKAFTATLASNGAGPGRNASYLSGLADPRAPGRGLRRADVPPAAFVLGARPVTPVTPVGAAPGAVAPDAVAPAPLPPVQLASVENGGNQPNGGGQPFAPAIQQPGAGSSGFAGTTPGGGTPGAPGSGTPGSGTPGAGNPGTVPATPTPVSPVPEPSTWAMLLSGFLVVGLALRMARRTRRATIAA